MKVGTQMVKKQPENEKGTVIVLVALLMSVFLIGCAFVVDMGILYVNYGKLQNAIDATVLAAAQELPDTISATNIANEYIELNGFSSADINVSFSDENNTINITGSKTINYLFARVFGLNSKTLSVSASAVKGNFPASTSKAFNYALFSGSSTSALTLNGSKQTINGSSHTNKNFSANGSQLTITGDSEAVTTVSVNGSQISIGRIVQNAPFVDMPDFSDQIKTLSDNAGQTYTGDKTYSGNVDVPSPIYVTGNLTVNGSRFSGKGTIVATGSITFNGSNVYATSEDSICFYSKTGNITINGSHAVLNGIVYAPKGTITMNGSNQTVNGRVIGNVVTINGSSLTITSRNNDLESLPAAGAKLIN